MAAGRPLPHESDANPLPKARRRKHARGTFAAALRRWLSPTQREQSTRGGYFEVFGSDSGKRYRIHAGASVNVCEIDERGRLQEGLCFMPIGALPIGDVMLAQKIALETCEDKARAVARRFTPNGFHFRQSRPLG
jgi:hypothetical protein